MKTIENLGALVGRFLMAYVFVTFGLMKFRHLTATADLMASHGLPDPAGLHLLALAAGLVEVVGSLSLFVGLQTRLTALVLFLYLIPTTIIFHIIPGDPMERVNAFKNLAIMGGLLIVATQGGGGLSFDSSRPRAA